MILLMTSYLGLGEKWQKDIARPERRPLKRHKYRCVRHSCRARPCEFIGFGFGAMGVTKPYQFQMNWRRAWPQILQIHRVSGDAYFAHTGVCYLCPGEPQRFFWLALDRVNLCSASSFAQPRTMLVYGSADLVHVFGFSLGDEPCQFAGAFVKRPLGRSPHH
jgi:hypothetical protein